MSELVAAPPTAPPTLRHNTLGLRHAIVISVAVMSPAASIFFNSIPQAGLVGGSIPFCYLIGFTLSILVANQYSQFSREIHSSGSAYSFVTAGLGQRLGFFTGWVGVLAAAVGVPYTFVLLGTNLETLGVRLFGVDINWSIWFVLGLGIAFALCYRGVRESMNVDLTFLVVEIVVCLILGALVLLKVGQQGGLTLAPFTPALIPVGGDLPTGIVLSALSYIGFETAAALGEETRNPRRNIPLAVFGSMVVVGVFYVFMAYIGTVGYGPAKMVTGFANDGAPFDTIGRQYGGSLLAIFIDLVGIMSFFAAALAIINGSSRMIYKASDEGALPSFLAILHPRRNTPIGGISMLCIFGLLIGLPIGFALSPLTAFGFFGTLDAALVLVIYLLVCVASIRFFWTQRRSQVNLFHHALIPGLGALIIGAIFVLILISPASPPLNAVPFVVIGWMLLGLIVLVIQRFNGRSDTPPSSI